MLILYFVQGRCHGRDRMVVGNPVPIITNVSSNSTQARYTRYNIM